MSLEKTELKKLILEKTPLEFCRQHLFDQNVYLFENSEELGVRGSYHNFKCEIANALETSPNNVAIVGSGKFGYSMNPTKTLLKSFNHSSDIDLVIACPQTFDKIWKQLRKAYYSNQTDVRKNHADDIFSKFIVVNNKMEYQSSHLRETISMLDEMKKNISRAFRIKRVINYRIYANWLDVEDYHEFGVGLLKNVLNGPRGDEI
ncbi:hypothetical protein [Photobacterium halotolerans]|uniref:Uncharacterized protein n=1 Tax=Photobacterium halotolerans TaxID=265726 RepID=A0A0F5V9E1_9GAMM|nr:hypothetical protein [Photobacterium halotolerans]KKC98748.1 hypothetical protein KY46_16610 [Photobacterium halotolerans]